VGDPVKKRPLGRLTCRLEGNTTIMALYLSASGYKPMTGFCEYDNESLYFIK